MKIYRHLLFILLLLLALEGCIDEKNTEPTTKGGEFHMTLVLKVPAVTDVTRALRAGDENQIHSLDVLVFTNKVDSEGTFLYHAHGTDFTTSGSTSTASVMLKESLSGEQHNLVLLANLRQEIAGLSSAITEGMTKEEVLKLISFDTAAGWDVTTPRYLPMWGESGFRHLSATTNRINGIRMLRSVATVDVILAPNAKNGDRMPAAFSNFTLKTLKVCNVSKRGLAAPESTHYNPDVYKVSLPSVPEGTTKGTLSYDFSTQFGADYRISREIYLAESSNNETSLPHTEMTSLLISGYYGEGNTSEETWYRMDFIEDKVTGDRFDILRNHRYTFYITAVEGPGYSDENEALQSAPFNIESQIVAWDDNEAGDTWVDGIYYLSIRPETMYTFHSDADAATVRVKTDNPAGFQIIKITEEDGTPGTGWLSTDKVVDTFYGSEEEQVEVTMGVEENTSGSPRTGYIYLKAGRIEARLTVTQGIEPKRSVIFNFIEYINVHGIDREVPREGGDIRAIVNGNVGWKLRTDIQGVEDSMEEPASDVADNYTLSVTFPRNQSWETLSTKVWVEYKGIPFQETIFTQPPGYYITDASATEVASATGGTSTVTITGSVPELQIRVVSEDVVIATGTTTAGSTAGIGYLSIPSTDEEREVTIQYSKDGGNTWEDITTFTQRLSIAGRFAKSNIVWDEVNQKLTFATTREENALIPANSQGVFFKWGSLLAISPANMAKQSYKYINAKYPNGHIIYDPTDDYSYLWDNIPYVNETTDPFNDNDTLADDFKTYNGDIGYDENNGKGDICRYISAKGWVSGHWRMPTMDEYEQLVAEASISHGNFGRIYSTLWGYDTYHYGHYQIPSGYWLGTGVTAGGSETSPSIGVYIPASGYRVQDGEDGSNVGWRWWYWSGSSSSTANSYYLRGETTPAVRYSGGRKHGFPIRCILED